jgi:hypothetical protein
LKKWRKVNPLLSADSGRNGDVVEMPVLRVAKMAGERSAGDHDVA